MREIYRILDANFNRAREALRVAEDCGRFALNDVAITVMAKHMRSDLQGLLSDIPLMEMVASRDTPGDIGTDLTSPTELKRADMNDVAIAAMKRLGESLRSIEEYSKVVAPAKTLDIERMRYNAYTLEQRLLGRLFVRRFFADIHLYVLVDSSMCRGSVREIARAAIAGQTDVVQVREKNIPDSQFLALAAEMRDLTDETGKMLIINDRADIAAMVGADGLHVGQHDLPVAEARRLLRPGALIGKSTHTIEQARAAVTEGADYIAVGPIFATATKDAGPPVGVELLKQILAEVQVPVVPVGGITAANVAQIRAAGATRAAVCSGVICAENPRTAAQHIRDTLTQA
ncbi:MAG: thiamine phosphate synthase [Planctomycetaceae bacterium]|nr:thiamine phosphate synthase [Planctomycetaceae bacterium]